MPISLLTPYETRFQMFMVLPTVQAFRAAVADYRRRVVETTKSRLDVKCAGWTAGFPVGNIIIRSFGDLPEDYIGPGMDIGFRLVKAASPRRMLISAELAWLLTLEQQKETPKFYVDGGLELKGVARGKAYPSIWLDNYRDARHRSSDDLLTLEEEALRHARPQPCDPWKLHHYCDHWLRHMGPPFVVPFISSDATIAKPQTGYSKWLAQVSEQDDQGTEETMKPPRKTEARTADDIVSSLKDAMGKPEPSKAQHSKRRRKSRTSPENKLKQ